MSELSIPQVQKILGWSWPTAYKYAQQYGRKVDGQWYLPYDFIASKVQNELVKADRMHKRLVDINNGAQT